MMHAGYAAFVNRIPDNVVKPVQLIVTEYLESVENIIK